MSAALTRAFGITEVIITNQHCQLFDQHILSLSHTHVYVPLNIEISCCSLQNSPAHFSDIKDKKKAVEKLESAVEENQNGWYYC